MGLARSYGRSPSFHYRGTHGWTTRPRRSPSASRRARSYSATTKARPGFRRHPPSPAGDGLYGTNYADTIYGYGGADLIYGYGGADTLYGGNESGWGDKILGGAANDRVLGQGGDDALYGQGGKDRVYGGYGNDLIVGGYGEDTLKGGPGTDEINAQDGQRDFIDLCGDSPSDVVYYDSKLDVLSDCSHAPGSASLSASEANTAGKANLSTEQPPKGLFEHTGKVLVDHKGTEKCVAEQALKGHLKHGAKIVNPAGCSSAEEGRS